MDADSRCRRASRPQFGRQLFDREDFNRGIEFKIATNFVAKDDANWILEAAKRWGNGDTQPFLLSRDVPVRIFAPDVQGILLEILVAEVEMYCRRRVR